MQSVELELILQTQSGEETIQFLVRRLVCAGWVGRDPRALQAHIEELAQHGVAGPTRTPTYMHYAPYLAGTGEITDVVGPHSSGEVEFVILKHARGVYIGAGSDHTDREMEKYSIPASKQMCAKILAPVVWPYDEMKGHWDEIVLRSWVEREGERVLYQEDALGTILDAEALLKALPSEGGLPVEDMVVFSGTVATKAGLVFGERFDFEMEDPVLGRAIRHGYRVNVLPQYL
jgi:hypothetical protein